MDQQRNQRRNQKIPETNKNGNTTYQNLQDAIKAILRKKFRVINAYIKKKEKTKILSLYLKELKN